MSFKFSYKWPTAKTDIQQNIIQQAISRETKQEVLPTKQTLGIGITTVIFFIMTFLYIYISALIKQKNIDSVSSFFQKFILSCKDLSIFDLNTLSRSIQNSERIGTTIGLVVFLALLQALLSYQNIYSNDIKRAPIIAFNYIIILCWLLFMFIFPENTVGKVSKNSKGHSFLAFCVIISLIINCFLIKSLYEEYYDEKSIEPLTIISYVIVGVAVVAGISMIFHGFSDKLKQVSRLAVAYGEIACLFLFAVFLTIFIQFPPLPNDQLSCVMVP